MCLFLHKFVDFYICDQTFSYIYVGGFTFVGICTFDGLTVGHGYRQKRAVFAEYNVPGSESSCWLSPQGVRAVTQISSPWRLPFLRGKEHAVKAGHLLGVLACGWSVQVTHQPLVHPPYSSYRPRGVP